MEADNDCADSVVKASAADLHAEIDRLREDNADLRASALRWKELYEAVIAGTRDSAGHGVMRRPGRRRAPLLPASSVPDSELHSRAVDSADLEFGEQPATVLHAHQQI